MRTPTASPAPIVALDLGKYKRVACRYDGDPATARFQPLTACRSELTRLPRRHPGAVVLIETCASAGWAHDLCTELGPGRLVANAAAEARKSQHAKREADRDDAPRLA